ncbi:MAG: hypothetical protein ACFBSC_05150 [Microcoleaceae cyanobacterium]
MDPYEFSSSQNELVGDLAKKMNFVGILMIAAGIISLISGLVIIFSGTVEAGVGQIIQGVFSLIVGLWTRNAGSAFQKIVATVGSDIENLMIALGELRKLYTLQYWLVIIVLVFMILALVLGLIVGIGTSLG